MPLSAPTRSGTARLARGGRARLRAQGPVSDRPEPFTPARPETRQELDRREALKLYGLGVFHEHDNRLLAAVRAYEDAPASTPRPPPRTGRWCPFTWGSTASTTR